MLLSKLNRPFQFHLQKYLFAAHKRFSSCCDNKPEKYDLVIVGGGIVGCASAREVLCRNPALKVAVLEKEYKVAFHQSGHNSGVIHAGIYYKPGTLKAKLCVEGLNLTYKYCCEKNIPFKKCGKLIVATNDCEVGRLMGLYDRGLANNVPNLKLITAKEIPNYQPKCKGLRAIWSPETGIVDWEVVTKSYAKDIQCMGGDILLDFEVDKFTEDKCDRKYPVKIKSKKGDEIQTSYVLTCAGLQSDIMAEKTGCAKDPRIIPFRGEYLLLNKDKCNMIQTNIYPVPDPRFPFLGVHFTPRMDGSVWLGPNAILAFKREGYRFKDFNKDELIDVLKYKGFMKMALKHAVFGITEMVKSFCLPLQVKALQQYIPEITAKDVTFGPAGVRAQALDLSGNLVDDFIFDRGAGSSQLSHRVLHCRNAPSPGATSSLAIAKMIAEKLNDEFSIFPEVC